MVEYFRQTAFVSSVLAGFAFTFYGTLICGGKDHRAGAWAAFFALAASIMFLSVTLGMTFAAVHAAADANPAPLSQLVSDAKVQMLSTYFMLGIICLIVSFGVSGWSRSRGLGIATTILAVVGAVMVFSVLQPYLIVVRSP